MSNVSPVPFYMKGRKFRLRRLIIRVLKITIAVLFAIPFVMCAAFLLFDWPLPDFPRGSVIQKGNRFTAYRVLISHAMDKCLEHPDKQRVKACNPDLNYCDRPLSPTRAVRIVTYAIRRWENGQADGLSQSLFFLTNDAGKSWNSFLTSVNWLRGFACENIGQYDDDFFWFGYRTFLALTHDGGKTWHFWNPTLVTSLPTSESGRQKWTDDRFVDIEEIEFRNPEEGRMVLVIEYDFKPRARLPLYTLDGGKTWQPSDWSILRRFFPGLNV
jgi:hypothetical protein